jgi:hypothetical protein
LKSKKLFEFYFLAGGVLALGVALHMALTSYDLVKRGNAYYGKVIEINKSQGSRSRYSARIEILDPAGNIVRFKTGLSSSEPSYDVGDSVRVLAIPGDVENASIDSFKELWMTPIWLGPFGSLFFCAGFLPWFFRFRRRRLGAYLKRNGESVQARITEVSRNEFVRWNNVHPFIIKAEAEIEGVERRFKSPNLWYALKSRFDDGSVTVYYQKGRPGRYFMDIPESDGK